MCYIMITYSGIGDRDNIVDSPYPLYLAIVISAIMVVVNVYVMGKLTISRMIQ